MTITGAAGLCITSGTVNLTDNGDCTLSGSAAGITYVVTNPCC